MGIATSRGLLTLLLLGPLVCASPGLAQGLCEPEDTVGECWDRVRRETAPDATFEREAEDDVHKQPTGQDTGGTTLQSTTKDFLPLLSVAGLLGQGDLADDQGNLVADLNFLLPGGLRGKNSQLQAIAKTEVSVGSALRAALPEGSRDQLAGELEKDLSVGDDLGFSFTYNLQGPKRGRNFELYRGRFRALIAPLVEDMQRQSDDSDEELLAAHLAVACVGADDPADVTFEDVAESDGCGATEAERATAARNARRSVEGAARAFYSRLGDLRDAMRRTGLDRFGELVANQPQLHLSLKRNERNELAGPETTSGKLTFEWSRANLNEALASDECHRGLERAARAADRALSDRCLAEYETFMTDSGKEIAAAERISISLEYERSDSLGVPLSTLLPDSGLSDLHLPAAEKRIAAVGWSRNLVGFQEEPTRLDVVARYEDVSDDPNRRDRLVATATFELKLGQLNVPVGVVYANHGEYLAEVDEQLSAHLGLRFKLKGAGAGDE